MNNAERRIIEYESFLCGSIDGYAMFAQWRYAEAPSFQDSLALEIQTLRGSIEIQKRLYPLADEAQYADPPRVYLATLTPEA